MVGSRKYGIFSGHVGVIVWHDYDGPLGQWKRTPYTPKMGFIVFLHAVLGKVTEQQSGLPPVEDISVCSQLYYSACQTLNTAPPTATTRALFPFTL